MASVTNISPNHWELHLASRAKSEVRVDIHMSNEAAKKILDQAAVEFETQNPGNMRML